MMILPISDYSYISLLTLIWSATVQVYSIQLQVHFFTYISNTRQSIFYFKRIIQLEVYLFTTTES